MKILNLYAGIGGNRKLWGNEHEVTAIEINPEIVKIYQDFFPNDKVVVGDAHEYLLQHFQEFDFIWSSPRCPTHSRMRFNHKVKFYPDMSLYQEILLLKHFFKGIFIVENVIPYYEPLIKPEFTMHRHSFWTNIFIPNIEIEKFETCKKLKEREYLQEKFGFNLDKFSKVDKRLLLRNCVVPELGLHIFKQVLSNSSPPVRTSDKSDSANAEGFNIYSERSLRSPNLKNGSLVGSNLK